jgi:elongation of very long chain fatty acids protein 4
MQSQQKYLSSLSSDRRQDDLFLIRNSMSCLPSIIGAYIVIVKFGPKLMENRKPFDLKNVMMIYNLIQVIANTAIGVYVSGNRYSSASIRIIKILCCDIISKGIYHGILKRKMKLICAPVDYSDTRDAIIDARLCYYYTLLKISDLLDTVRSFGKYTMQQIY